MAKLLGTIVGTIQQDLSILLKDESIEVRKCSSFSFLPSLPSIPHPHPQRVCYPKSSLHVSIFCTNVETLSQPFFQVLEGLIPNLPESLECLASGGHSTLADTKVTELLELSGIILL